MEMNQKVLPKNNRGISYVISYVVASWGILQFTDWFIKHYNYSTAWVDVLLLFLVAMLPSVILVALAFSNVKVKQKVAIGSIPVNLILAVGFIYYIFSGVSLGSTAKEITIVDEEGKEVKRNRPTVAFTKRMIIYPAEVEGFGEEEQWKSLAFSYLQKLDLEQNKRFYNFSPFSLKERVEKYDYKVDEAIPFSVKQKVAEDAFSDFFVTSKLKKEAEKINATVEVFSTQSGKSFFEGQYEGADIYGIVDQFSKEIEEKIFSKELNLEQEESLDLPATELLTDQIEALGYFTEGLIAIEWDNNPAAGIGYLEKAIKTDPEFADGHAKLGTIYFGIGQPAKGEAAFRKAMALIEPLPERQQLAIKSQNYLFRNELEKGTRLLEMWRQLYPNDYSPYPKLFSIYQVTGNFEKAEEVGLSAIDNGHIGPMYTNLAQLYTMKKEFDKAEEYYKKYAEAFPSKAKDSSDLGTLYIEMGDYKKAEKFFEDQALLNPNDHMNYISLSDIASRTGDLEKEMRLLEKALRLARQATDSILVYRYVEAALDRTGQIDKAIQTMETRWELMNKHMPPVVSASEALAYGYVLRYTSVGRDQEILDKIEKLVPLFSNAQFDVGCVAKLNYCLIVEDLEAIRKLQEQCPEAIKQGSVGAMEDLLRGYIAKMSGDYENAILALEEVIANSGSIIYIYDVALADTYRLAGKHEKALANFEKLVKNYPNVPLVFYKKAMAHRDADQPQKAVEAAEKAMKMLEKADENYDILVQTKELLNELSS